MERIILGIIIGIGVTVLFGILGAHDYHEDCNVSLEKQHLQYRQMLADTHNFYEYLLSTPNTITLSTDMTAREMLWRLEETFKDNDCVQVVK